ncbi:hypothetical protein F5148DRAFT_1147445 [Russula earlei]|uniref:Uncharacterized protein n=1 Tax=Russula earlei TaxID=71964 RepID=A0ACC0UH60_9AGAM|nr:hypothetical protein F5148DRAFT_1147445 [Russula earlei]
MTGNIEYPRRERAPMRSWTQAQRGVLKPVREGDTKACLSFQREKMQCHQGFRPYTSQGVEILSIPSQTFLTELQLVHVVLLSHCRRGMVGAEVSLCVEHGHGVVKQGACVGCFGAVAAAVDTEVMAVARARVVVREGGGVERHGCSDEVFAIAGGGSMHGCDGRGGEVWHGACIGSISCGDIMVAGSNYSAGQHCGICLSEAVACVLFIFQLSVCSFLVVQGGMTARNRSMTAVWSGSRAVAGTRPRTAVNKAEGMVAMAGCAGNMGDVTEEAEAEVVEDKTGMEMGDEEVAVGIDVMAGVGDVETGEESMGVDDAETVAGQTETVVWDGAMIGRTCTVTMEMAGNETTVAAMGDVGEVVVAGDSTEGMGVASHHSYAEFLRLDLRVGMN